MAQVACLHMVWLPYVPVHELSPAEAVIVPARQSAVDQRTRAGTQSARPVDSLKRDACNGIEHGAHRSATPSLTRAGASSTTRLSSGAR